MRHLKLGKKPASNRITFKLKNFIDPSALPKPPRTFGHDTFIGKKNWGMLGNDYVGDCAFADAAHQTMLWNASAGRAVTFDDKAVLSDYSALTGYDGTEATDQGTDMQEIASYRRKTGIVDAQGNRHFIKAYLSISPGDIYEHYIALYLFESISLGIELPSSAMDQFDKGKTWSVVKGASNLGGHAIPLVAKRRSLKAVTWGELQAMTIGFFGHYNDESVAYLSEEMLTNRKSPEGFDYDGLIKCLNALK